MKKYFTDRGGNHHGGDIHWPGTPDGFPFRGEVPDFKQAEFDNIPLALDYRAKLFILSDEQDMKEWLTVMDRVVNGWYMQHNRIDRWSDDPVGPVVWLEWVQIYGEHPHGKIPNGQTFQHHPS